MAVELLRLRTADTPLWLSVVMAVEMLLEC
jgi:hypothetical protein